MKHIYKILLCLLTIHSTWALDAVLIQTENSNVSLVILKNLIEKKYNIPKRLIKIEYRSCDLSEALIHFCLKDEALEIKRLNRTFYEENFLQFKELNEELENE